MSEDQRDQPTTGVMSGRVRPRVVAVVNLKGGTGKTTTAAFLGHAWAATGQRVTFVDADHPQYALSRWAELAGWDLPVMGLGSKQLHVQLPGILTAATCDLAVIDTPPLEEHRGIVTAALRAADDVIVTLAPTTAELHRTGAVFDAIDDTANLRATPARVMVCLNRVDRRARADRIIRAALTDAGHHVLDHDVPSDRHTPRPSARPSPRTTSGPTWPPRSSKTRRLFGDWNDPRPEPRQRVGELGPSRQGADAGPTEPATPAAPRTAPRTRPYRLTVDLPPAVHTRLSRWVIDLEEQAGHNVDKRAVVLALLDLLHTDDQVAATVRTALTTRR